MVSLNHHWLLSVRISPSFKLLLLLPVYRFKLPALFIDFEVLFHVIMPAKRKRKSAEEITDSDANIDVDSNPLQPPLQLEEPKRRGRPPGSRNKVVVDADSVQAKESGGSGESHT